MNAVFSLFLSLVLLFSSASLPDVPETAAVTNLRNVRVTLDGETETLPHEFILTTAAGMKEIGAAFEIRNGEETLLSLAAVLTGEALDYSLSDAGHYFYLSDEGLAESGMAPFAEEEAQVFDQLVTAALHYQEAMRIYRENDLQPFDVAGRYIEALAAQAGVEAEDTQITLDGETHTARRCRFKATAADQKAAQIAMTRCGDPAIEALYMAVLRAAEPMEAAGEQIYPDASSYDVTFAEGEGWSRYKARISNGTATRQQISTRRGDTEIFSVNIKEKTEYGSSSFAISGELAGGSLSPGRGEAEFEAFMPMENDRDMALGGSLKLDGGAWELQMRFGRKPDALGPGIILNVSTPEETPEGAKRSITISAQGMDFSLSFDLLSSSVPYTSFFEGMEKKSYDPASDQDAAMTRDTLRLMTDAANFAADSDVVAVKKILADGFGRFGRIASYGDVPVVVNPPEGYSLMGFDSYDVGDGKEALWAFENGNKIIRIYFRTYEEEGYFYEFTPEGGMIETDSRFVGMIREPEWNGWYAYMFDPAYDFTFRLENIPDYEEAKALVAEICTPQ